MLRPDDLEALLAVCMVQGGFAVCAYCSKFCFLARRNPCLESLKLRIGGFFPQRCGALFPSAFSLAPHRPDAECRYGARRWWAQPWSQGRPPNAACRADTKVDHWLMEQ